MVIRKTSVGIRALVTSALCAASLFGLAACGGGSASPVSSSAESTAPKLTYPAAPRGEQVDDYHGEKVADPYR